MAVKVIQEENPLKKVGSLMTLAGLAIPGAGALATLGMGLSSAAGGMDDQQNTVFERIMNNVMTGQGNGWLKPAWGSKNRKAGSHLPLSVNEINQIGRY